MPATQQQNTDSALTPLQNLKGVGPRVAQRLARLHIYSIEDLLFHLPLRYQDRTRIVPIGSLRHGDQAVIQGTIQLSEIKYGKRRMLLCHIQDGSGIMLLRFFHFSSQQKQMLARGTVVRCFGDIRKGKQLLELVHPEYRIINAEDDNQVEECLTPIYPTTEGLHQLSLRGLTDQALQWLATGRLHLAEVLPQHLLDKMTLPALADAIQYIHRPPPDVPLDALADNQHPMQLRLAFEELLAHTLSMRQLRNAARQHNAYAITATGSYIEKFLKLLPFSLTAAQQRVLAEIKHDLAQPAPMQRLVQGDVGSGKTIVALIAALEILQADYQVALMAPTEILAEQHFANFSQWLSSFDIKVCWLSGKLKTAARREVLREIESGEAKMVVGTHALFQAAVTFDKLALVIVDEQHRFGVEQRQALREKGVQDGHHPHQLIMTATPIPRTLAMTAYADLDVSVIDELPPGRKPVETVVISDSRRDAVMQRVRVACQQGRQVYWVCPLIEESEALQCQAAEDAANALAEILPDIRLALIHGRLKAEQKETIMAGFKQHEIDLLVATTVIEVGVDVPNASLMIIDNSERYGLAQLHQLRGRVGRGDQESVCVLMYHGALSEMARARLAVMRETNDGFVIARKDLELRGPGEVLGTRQTGNMQLRIADLLKHQFLLDDVNRWVDQLLQQHPQSVAALLQRWIGERSQYANV